MKMSINEYFDLDKNFIDKYGHYYEKKEVLDFLAEEIGILNIIKYTPYAKFHINKGKYRYTDILKYCGYKVLKNNSVIKGYSKGLYKEFIIDNVRLYGYSHADLAYMMLYALTKWAKSDMQDIKRIRVV